MNVLTLTADGGTKRAPVPGREPFASAAATLLNHVGCLACWRTSSNGGYAQFTRPFGLDRKHYLVTAPEPRGPVSFATVAHEVGHHDLGHLDRRVGRTRGPRWWEEVEAWVYALDAFDDFDLPGKDRARRSAEPHLQHAFTKALRRSPDPEKLAARFAETLAGAGLAEEHRAWVQGLARRAVHNDAYRRALTRPGEEGER
jgi:hypothetical protein